MYCVYILRTLDDSLYIGVTENLDERTANHNRRRGADWTKAHYGARLAYSETQATLGSARKREMQLKKWSRPKKEALIAGNVAQLKKLSRSKSTVRRQQQFEIGS